MFLGRQLLTEGPLGRFAECLVIKEVLCLLLQTAAMSAGENTGLTALMHSVNLFGTIHLKDLY